MKSRSNYRVLATLITGKTIVDVWLDGNFFLIFLEVKWRFLGSSIYRSSSSKCFSILRRELLGFEKVTTELVDRGLLKISNLSILIGSLDPHFKLHYIFKKLREVIKSCCLPLSFTDIAKAYSLFALAEWAHNYILSPQLLNLLLIISILG